MSSIVFWDFNHFFVLTFEFIFDTLGVLAPMAIDILLDELGDVNFATVSSDTSNKGNFKILPVMLRYFSLKTGIQTKLIDVFRLDDETGETLFNKLKSVCEKYGIWSKIKGFSADSAVENFGGITRGGDKNVFYRLRKELGDIVGVGCPSHLAHKGAEKACDQFQPFFDIEATVVNIYNHFKTSTTRNTRLQQLVDPDDVELKLLGYAKTRFIGFKGCIDRIIDNFDTLKTFFANETDAPISINRFFDHQLSKLILIFVRDQCEYFESVIRSLEGAHVCGYEAAQTILSFCTSIRQRMDEKFTSMEFQEELKKISKGFPFTDTVLKKVRNRNVAEEIRIDSKYIDDMVYRFQGNFSKILQSKVKCVFL